ncbi:MAG: ADP-heptose synthase [Rhodocyclaceae bacterium]|nr:MAG: ADP-heptose synthase [Rhodocyclaceae bacterium]
MDAIVKTILSDARGKKRIVFVSGTFNIVHPGHLRLLRFASECGDYLVVGVLSDELAKSAQLKEQARLEGVAAINWVNHAFVLASPPEDLIQALQPAVVVMGNEHEHAVTPELDAVHAYGGQVLFGSGDTTFSSLELLRKESELINHSSIIRPSAYIANHSIDVGCFGSVLEKIQGLKVCVVGDIIVDEYIQCDPLGMSQEDPTIVVAPIMANKFLGGAGIVAAHARGLGAQKVSFVSVTGDDEVGRYAADKLQEYGVTASLLVDDSRPTTLKQRYRAGNKTLLRVNHLRQHKLSKPLQKKALERVKRVLGDADLLIFSDFNYGALPQELVDQITQECTRRGIMMVADSQSSSQIGDVSRFTHTALLTPTEREARLALGNYDDGLVVLAEALRKKTHAQNIVITLGAEGLLLHVGDPNQAEWLTDRLAALNTSPKDTAGAGDCLLVCTALAMAVGRPIWESIYLGSIAAACQVGRIGNIPLSATELLVEVNKSNDYS